jgi:hypothetical protein
MPVKLIAVDLDGTLLTRDKTPHPRSVTALLRAQAAGITVVLASGRALPAVRSFAAEIGLTGPMIGANGADTGSPWGEIWRHDGIKSSAASKMVQVAIEREMSAAVYASDRVYMVRRFPGEVVDTSRILRCPTEVIDPSAITPLHLSKVLVMQDPEISAANREALLAAMDPAVLRTTDSEPYFIEFLAPNTSKASALAEVASRLGVSQRNTAAIGDYDNDLEMIQWAGHGAAIGNALPRVKAAAEITVGTKEEGGVADFVDHLLSKR